MFLLILKQAAVRNYNELYLHSTMFLLILAQGGDFVGGLKFTFHNVSINTKFLDTFFVEFLNLHSTMFLLIRLCVRWVRVVLFRFTFHNVSINTANVLRAIA